jgi:hypothetical protein
MNEHRDVHESGDYAAPRPHKDATPGAQPLADREAPLDATTTHSALHAWLDGELSDASVTIAEQPRTIELWKRVGADAARLRMTATPASVEAFVMGKIRSGEVTPMSAAGPVVGEGTDVRE